ncbi:hypothetical protein, partial [Megasphaera sp.]|uniref:hypothetical protein n=1 Tax=Megasphaera sp. TaxID=2023260 RepID=UPI003AF907C2
MINKKISNTFQSTHPLGCDMGLESSLRKPLRFNPPPVWVRLDNIIVSFLPISFNPRTHLGATFNGGYIRLYIPVSI